MIYAILVILAIVVGYFVLGSSSRSFTAYIIAFHMIFGWFLLFFALGTGLVALPFELIYQFATRPKPMKAAEFEVQKKTLLNAILFIRLRCNEALEERIKYDNQRNIKRWWNMSRLNRKVASLHVKAIILESQYVRLIKISKYSKYIEPMVDYLKLFAGILIIIVNLLFFVQILACQVLEPSNTTECKFSFLNSMIQTFSKESVGLGFLTTGIIFLLSCHLTFSAFYGNQKLGLRFSIYTYAPLTLGETLFNNICYNVLLVNLWSAAIIQLLIQCFKKVLQEENTQWSQTYYGEIRLLSFHKEMYKNSIFIYMMFAVSFLFLIYQFIYPDDLQYVLKSVDRKKNAYNTIQGRTGTEEPMIDKDEN